jgi:DnaJ-class molecular chaperone
LTADGSLVHPFRAPSLRRRDQRSVRTLRLQFRENITLEAIMANEKGPNVKKKAKCKNCEGKGLLKKGDKVVKCQRCHGTGLR